MRFKAWIYSVGLKWKMGSYLSMWVLKAKLTLGRRSLSLFACAPPCFPGGNIFLLGLWKPQGPTVTCSRDGLRNLGAAFLQDMLTFFQCCSHLWSGAEKEVLSQQTEIWFRAHKSETGRQIIPCCPAEPFSSQGCWTDWKPNPDVAAGWPLSLSLLK